MSNQAIVIMGTGAIGTAVAERLLDTGHQVVVWNRTPRRIAALTERGAGSASTAADAAAAGSLILFTLTNYHAVHECLDQLGDDLAGRTVVVMSTGTPAEAMATAERVVSLGAGYLDVGVQASPDQIVAGNALLLCSGSEQVMHRHRGTLGVLGPVRYVGTRPESAAIWDLTLFGLWYDAQLGLLRALDTVRAAGMDVDEFATAAELQLGHVVNAAKPTAAEVLAGDYPAGPATLAEHLPVLRQVADLRSSNVLADGGLRVPIGKINTLIAAGRATEGLTAIVDPA